MTMTMMIMMTVMMMMMTTATPMAFSTSRHTLCKQQSENAARLRPPRHARVVNDECVGRGLSRHAKFAEQERCVGRRRLAPREKAHVDRDWRGCAVWHLHVGGERVCNDRER